MIKIKIPSAEALTKMITWRDENKELVKEMSDNNIEEGIIDFRDLYQQHFIRVGKDKVFMEVNGGGFDIKFVYNISTWQGSLLSDDMPKEMDYTIDQAMQDMITVYATSMALIKNKHKGIVSKEDEYTVLM